MSFAWAYKSSNHDCTMITETRLEGRGEQSDYLATNQYEYLQVMADPPLDQLQMKKL